MVDTTSDEAALKLPPELPTVGVVILAAAPQLDVRKDRKVPVSQARRAFLENLMHAYGNCGRELRDDWVFPSGYTWEVGPGLAGQIADHAPGEAVLVNLGPSVRATGRHDVWWSKDAERRLAEHLVGRRVAASLVSVRTATTAEVTVYRGGREWPGARMIDLSPCLLTRRRSA